MSAELEAVVDNILVSAAMRTEKEVADKKFTYRLDSLGFTVKPENTGKTGECIIKSVRYSRDLDCNVYTMVDTATQETFSACQFEIDLTEVKTWERARII